MTYSENGEGVIVLVPGQIIYFGSVLARDLKHDFALSMNSKIDGELIRNWHRRLYLDTIIRYLPVKDANHTIFTSKSYHAVIWGPSGLDFTKTTHFGREAKDLKVRKVLVWIQYGISEQLLTSLT